MNADSGEVSSELLFHFRSEIRFERRAGTQMLRKPAPIHTDGLVAKHLSDKSGTFSFIGRK
jgi:hypothetical protein